MKHNINFEDAIEQIEQIINRFEDEVINLNDSIELYKKGHELIKSCQNKLSSVEQQIKIYNPDSAQLDNFDGK